MIDYYELLGISRVASDEDIQIAYAVCVKRAGDDVAQQELLKKASQTLLHKVVRPEYDRSLTKHLDGERNKEIKAKAERERRQRQDASAVNKFREERLQAELEKNMEKEKKSLTAEESRQQEAIQKENRRRRVEAWRKQGFCLRCGGKFKGVFKKVCRDCGISESESNSLDE